MGFNSAFKGLQMKVEDKPGRFFFAREKGNEKSFLNRSDT
jgi:hypothetical protein